MGLCEGAYESMYGRIEVSWEQKEDGYEYHIVIPANTTATVELAGMERMELGSGTYNFANQYNIMKQKKGLKTA